MVIRFLKNDSVNKDRLRIVIFAAYLFVLFYFTLFSESLGRTQAGGEMRYNLMPFAEISRFWIYRHRLGMWACVLNIFGNAAAFVPCGFLVPMIFKNRRTFAGTVLAGFMISLAIECTQLVFRVGSFDVDDIMLNTLGSVLGFWMSAAVCRWKDMLISARIVMIREIELEE